MTHGGIRVSGSSHIPTVFLVMTYLRRSPRPSVRGALIGWPAVEPELVELPDGGCGDAGEYIPQPCGRIDPEPVSGGDQACQDSGRPTTLVAAELTGGSGTQFDLGVVEAAVRWLESHPDQILKQPEA
jgi:hypothetical protein